MSVNFTPSMGSIKDMKPFKFWCQKVLPTVYDDSLSYYELLNKVVNYLNDNVDNINLLNDNVTNLYNAYVLLQDYVNNYFDQNFPELVSDKLDEMAEDGTLTALIKAYIDPYFEEKSDEIDETISAQNDVIDLLSTQMTEFIANHAGLVTETVLWNGEGSGDGFIFNLSDSATNYNYIDVHVDFTSLVTGTKLTYKGGVLRFNSQDFADGKCMVTIPVVNPNTSDIGVLEMRFTPDENVANRYTLVGCNKVTADRNGYQLEVVTAGYPGGTSANDPSCGGITKIVGVKNEQNDQEIINARIGADGTVYATLGDAIRAQISALNGGLSDAVVSALLDIVEHIALWTDGNAELYIERLRTALRPPVNVTRIEATYTQTGTVYSNASLDSLRPNLVVTAYYDNGTSEVVTNYTLSGTLAVGTSTITASYGDKTDTFNVTVTEYVVPTYSIVNNLTNVTNSNSATSITENYSYSATLTAQTGYYIASITITMGGTDVTNLYYADGLINIGAVTGNVVITAIGEVEPETGLVYSNSEPIVTTGSALVDTGFAPNDGAFTIMCEWSGASFSNNGLLFSLFQNVNANTPVVAVSMGYPATTYGLVSYNFRNDASDINTTVLRVVVTKSAGSSNPRWYYKDTNGSLVTKSQSNTAVTPTGNIYIGGKVTSADGSSASNYVRATFNTFKCYNVVCNENKIKGFLEVE